MNQLPEEPLYGNEAWQQQMDEEQRRQEECACTPLTKYADCCAACKRAFDESVRISAYANQRRIPIEERYDSRGDMAPFGRNIAVTNRRVVNPQMRANIEYSDSLKGKRR